MRIDQILVEHVINAFKPADKERYADLVWDMLQTGYASVGGFHSSPDKEDLVNNTGLWKLVKRGDVITAVSIYKDHYGRKAIAATTDGTTQGRKDYSMISKEDMQQNRAWAEASGAPEKILMRMGAKPLPNKFAHILTGKEILNLNPDGYHYTRMIGGEPHEKIIFGVVKFSPAQAEALRDQGINLKDLPNSI